VLHRRTRLGLVLNAAIWVASVAGASATQIAAPERYFTFSVVVSLCGLPLAPTTV
jgi:hypothetical protein